MVIMAIRNMDAHVASIQWWTIVGSAMLTSGIVMIFLSFSSLEVVPYIPNSGAVNAFEALSGQTFIAGVIGICLGLLFMLYSKFRLSRLALIEPHKMNKREEKEYEE